MLGFFQTSGVGLTLFDLILSPISPNEPPSPPNEHILTIHAYVPLIKMLTRKIVGAAILQLALGL